jgi:tRNA G18 (ribose-2'-O)-methylase SpoU
MTRKGDSETTRGYFEIGIYACKTPANLGTLWRSAYQMGAAGIFIIGNRFHKQASDTVKAWRHVPLRQYPDFPSFMNSRPYDCPLIGVEMGGKPLSGYAHPERASYLLGAEDHGLPQSILTYCQGVISLEAMRTESYNVAVAGSLVMYHRMMSKQGKEAASC